MSFNWPKNRGMMKIARRHLTLNAISLILSFSSRDNVRREKQAATVSYHDAKQHVSTKCREMIWKPPVCVATTVSVHCSARNDRVNGLRAVSRNTATPNIHKQPLERTCSLANSGSMTEGATDFPPCCPSSRRAIIYIYTIHNRFSSNTFVNCKTCH